MNVGWETNHRGRIFFKLWIGLIGRLCNAKLLCLRFWGRLFISLCFLTMQVQQVIPCIWTYRWNASSYILCKILSYYWNTSPITYNNIYQSWLRPRLFIGVIWVVSPFSFSSSVYPLQHGKAWCKISPFVFGDKKTGLLFVAHSERSAVAGYETKGLWNISEEAQ